jgi:hypothetical protein
VAWPEDDWRYGHPDWTLVTDATGSRFVEQIQRKRRRAPRALRFDQLEVGAVLLKRTKDRFTHYDPPFMEAIANDNGREEIAIRNQFGIVEDRWFDPCQGQVDRLKGEMASVRMVGPNGAWLTKLSHTLRGLASQGFDYASEAAADRIRAFVEERKVIIAAWTAGEISTSEAQLRASSYRRMMEELINSPS